MKSNTTILMTVVASLLISGPQLLTAQPHFEDAAACRIIDQKRPTQSVSFEGPASAQEVTLRLHNNTSCSIVVETDDRSPTHVTKLPDGRMKFEVVDGSVDGAKIGLHYFVERRKQWRAARPAYDWGDSVFTYEIRPGESALFSVPKNHFRKRLDVAVPFRYAWEGDGAIAMGVGGVVHIVYFLVEDVPAFLLR